MEMAERFASSSTYVFKKRIGSGGSAEVFLYSRQLDGLPEHEVALKVLKNQNEKLIAELINEGRKLSELKHPHIVTTLGYERIDSNQYALILEYIRGDNLKNIIGTISYRDRGTIAAYIIRALADALFFAHSHGIIHGDVSARNVLVSDRGAVKLSDFGLSTRTTSLHNHQKGSLDYLAPERWEGASSSKATDIFSLGVLAYEILSGTNPLQASKSTVVRKNLQAFLEDRPWQRYGGWESFFETVFSSNPEERHSLKPVLDQIPKVPYGAQQLLENYFTDSDSTEFLYQTQALSTAVFVFNRVQNLKRFFRAPKTIFEPILTLFLLITSAATGMDHVVGPARMKPSRLTVTSMPWGEVRIDGKLQGYTPLLNVPIKTGYHQFVWTDKHGFAVRKTIMDYGNGLFAYQIVKESPRAVAVKPLIQEK